MSLCLSFILLLLFLETVSLWGGRRVPVVQLKKDIRWRLFFMCDAKRCKIWNIQAELQSIAHYCIPYPDWQKLCCISERCLPIHPLPELTQINFLNILDILKAHHVLCHCASETGTKYHSAKSFHWRGVIFFKMFYKKKWPDIITDWIWESKGKELEIKSNLYA